MFKHVNLEKETENKIINYNYYNVPSNEHFWTDLNQILNYLKYNEIRDNFDIKYFIIGLYNTLDYGLDIIGNFDDFLTKNELNVNKPFTNINEIILFISSSDFNQTILKKRIENTINAGFKISILKKIDALKYNEMVKQEIKNVKGLINEIDKIFDDISENYNDNSYNIYMMLINLIKTSTNNLINYSNLLNFKHE